MALDGHSIYIDKIKRLIMWICSIFVEWFLLRINIEWFKCNNVLKHSQCVMQGMAHRRDDGAFQF